MESQQQKRTRAEQSRVNGAKSKGAATQAGKQKAANANRKHGAYAAKPGRVQQDEDHKAYAQLLKEAAHHFGPENLFEAEIVQEIVDVTWQIRHLTRHLLSANPDPDAPISAAERRLRFFRNQRARLILDFQRLKKLGIQAECSRAEKRRTDPNFVWDLCWVKPDGTPSECQPQTRVDPPEKPPGRGPSA